MRAPLVDFWLSKRSILCFLTLEDQLRALDMWWNMGDFNIKSVVRQHMQEHFGHSPDNNYTWGDVQESFKHVEPNIGKEWLGGCLSCSVHGDAVNLPVQEMAATGRNERLLLFMQLLKGYINEKDTRILRDSAVHQSNTLKVRMRITMKLALKMLKGRKDLIPYLRMLVDVHGLGADAFICSVAIICHWGVNPILDLCSSRNVFSCCHKCASDAMANFKTIARFGCSGGLVTNAELFDWQYVNMMLGRYDNATFADYEDLQTRINYEQNVCVQNASHPWRDIFDKGYETNLAMEGARFGLVCSQNRKASNRDLLSLCTSVLTSVPTGSIGSDGVNVHAKREIDKELMNKKLAIIYYTEGEEAAMKWCSANCVSGWLWKLEIAKLRNLVPGPLGLYMASAKVSMIGESAFLGKLNNCPLMWGETHKLDDERRFMEWQNQGYVANRDYKNYNLCHTHKRMQLFYENASRVCKEQKEFDLAKEFDYIISCLNEVGVKMEDGSYYKWEYGLQTGWAHTMLLHCVHNTCAARTVESIIEQKLGWRRYIGRHQGDDSAEVWSHALAGPLAQSILDCAGQVGQSTKQHFAQTKGEWSEFLRIWSRDGARHGSTIRALASFCSSDGQHKPYTGGMPMVQSIVSGLNTVWRRAGGKLGWRRQDVQSLLAYWTATNSQAAQNKKVDWRLFLSDATGMVMNAFPDMVHTVKDLVIKRYARHKLIPGPVMHARARRNLQKAARAQGAEKYAHEYAKDVIECAVEQSAEVEAGVVGNIPYEYVLSGEEEHVARVAYAQSQAAKGGWRDEDSFAREVVVGFYFAGSERVAKAYMKDGLWPVAQVSAGMCEILSRGLMLIAGKTRDIKPKGLSFYACAEKYWSHIELLLQKGKYTAVNHLYVGLRIANLAISNGEFV